MTIESIDSYQETICQSIKIIDKLIKLLTKKLHVRVWDSDVKNLIIPSHHKKWEKAILDIVIYALIGFILKVNFLFL